MNVGEFTSILKHPEKKLSREQTSQLEHIVATYPYFQAAHAVYLKGLKDDNNYKYNEALKQTAAHSRDRELLFNYITSDLFIEKELDHKLVKENKPKKEVKLKKGKEPLKVDLVTPVVSNTTSSKPLEFKAGEKHSFSVWLELTSAPTPIVDKKVPFEDKRFKKTAQIDAFLENKPKINAQKEYQSKVDVSTSSQIDESEIMTETLARVYLEQKKYDRAIQAYKILSLKYPEKNSFFAGQIKEITKIQKENNI